MKVNSLKKYLVTFLFVTINYSLILLSSDTYSSPSKENPAIQKAITHIMRDSIYSAPFNTKEGEEYNQFIKALAIMNYIQNRVSSTQYGYMKRFKETLPINDEEILEKEAGICGQHASLFLNLATRLGLTARSVEFYWPGKNVPLSHAAAEVLIGKQWVYFDISWGTYFQKDIHADKTKRKVNALSISEILELKNPMEHAVTNSANLAFFQQTVGGIDPFSYLKKGVQVHLGKTGIINFPVKNANEKFLVEPNGLPNYFGIVNDYTTGKTGNLQATITIPQDSSNIIFEDSTIACSNTNNLKVHYDNYEMELPLLSSTVKENFAIKIPKTTKPQSDLSLSIVPKNENDVCYIQFKRIVIN